MDSGFNHFSGGGFHNPQRRSFDLNPNNLDLLLQQDIGQQLSPGQPGSSDSSYSGSPAPAAPHQQTTTQPYAPQLQPQYRLPQSTTSPTVPQYSHAVSDALSPGVNFAFDMNFGNMPTANPNGMVRMRNNSAAELATFQAPNMHPSASSIGEQAAAHHQQALPRFSAPQLNATMQTPHLSPPAISPTTQPPRRNRPAQTRSSRDEDVIGLVLANKKKFKCAKSDCKEITFGRLADLRRHHEQQHARHRVQYYCSYGGCSRSHAPTGGRGRSFGTRKDKRDEHERNVHKKVRQNDQEYSYSAEESL